MDGTPIAMFIAVGLIFLLTLVWLVVQVAFAVRLTRLEGALDRTALVVWIVAVAGMFTGPCVAPIALAAVVFAAVRLRSAEGKDRHAYLAVLAGGGIGLVIAMVALLGAGLSGAFS